MNEKVVISVGSSFWYNMMSMSPQVITVIIFYKVVIKINVNHIDNTFYPKTPYQIQIADIPMI